MATEKVVELNVAERRLIVQGLEVLRAQTERAIQKETDDVVIEARKRRAGEIRSLMVHDMFKGVN